MKPIRKLIGLFIVIFITLPVLFSIIIAVGATNSIVSPELLSDLPREMVKNLPKAIDDLYLELKKIDLDDTDMDDDGKIWIKAILNAKKTPNSIIEESGISNWLKDELSVSLKYIGDILRGEAEPETVVLNFDKLKNALTTPAMIKYFRELIEQFPECTDSQINEWKDLDIDFDDISSMPACKPVDIEITDNLIKELISKIVSDMPDNIEIFQIEGNLPYGVDIAKFVTSITYLLFLIPIVFIIIGSAIGASTKRDFFRWSGYTTIIGGLSALGFTALIQNIIPLSGFALNFDHHTHIVSDKFEKILFHKISTFSDILFDKLFNPIAELGGTVAIIGLLLIGISYLVQSKDND